MDKDIERQLGEMLVAENLLTEDQLEQVLAESNDDGLTLIQLAAALIRIDPWELVSALSKQLKIPIVKLAKEEIRKQVLQSVDAAIIKKHRIIPIDRTGDTVMIALSDPSNLDLLKELPKLTGFKIFPVVATQKEIDEAIVRYYSDE